MMIHSVQQDGLEIKYNTTKSNDDSVLLAYSPFSFSGVSEMFSNGKDARKAEVAIAQFATHHVAELHSLLCTMSQNSILLGLMSTNKLLDATAAVG